MSSINKREFVRLLRLMTETEKRSFKAELNLGESLNDKAILAAIEKLPGYESLRAFIRAVEPTLTLLREIFEILETFKITTKTTGCVFVLANPVNPEERSELAFSQQTVGAVCNWSARNNWNRASHSLSDLQLNWMKFRPNWQTLIQKARPTRRRRRHDVVQSYIRGEARYRPERYHFDENAQKVLRYFGDRVESMANRLIQIPDGKRPRELSLILDDARKLINAVEDCLHASRARYSPRNNRLKEPPDQSNIERYVSQRFVSDFDKFLEDLYTLSDLLHGEDVVDMLRVDIWSTRPQLFEIWVLLRILSWLRDRGYDIDFLKTESLGDQNPVKWNLSYSKESKPCAVLTDPQTGIKQYVFYQLHGPSGDMPDISLLESSNPHSSPIWSVDPKHSEKGGYSRSDYQAPAVRYRDSFGAKLSVVVEYFDRLVLGDTNPIEFGPHARLIRSCRPRGNGLPLMLNELAKFHPKRSKVLVCIDFSCSFCPKRETALEELRQSFSSGHLTNVATECICFAESTANVINFDKWLRAEHGHKISANGLGRGTASAPLLRAISECMERAPISEVLLVTDGEFEVPVDVLTNRIQDDLGISVRVFAS